MVNLRTDLAVESLYTHKGAGIVEENEEKKGINITKIEIKTDEASNEVKKPKGTYITLESEFIRENDTEKAEQLSKELSFQLKALINKYFNNIQNDEKILICGLGNRNITADALGPDCVGNIMVTNHIISILNDSQNDFSRVSAITPGVMGLTGIETNNIIKGIKDEYKPSLIIAVDALCAITPKRMFGTIQLTDTGINPGSGVGNRRGAINKETMKVPVIAIGIPTVVDANSIIYDAFSQSKKQSYSDNEINNILMNVENYFVSPKDIDSLIKRSAKIIANGINLALHKDIDFAFIENYIS